MAPSSLSPSTLDAALCLVIVVMNSMCEGLCVLLTSQFLFYFTCSRSIPSASSENSRCLCSLVYVRTCVRVCVCVLCVCVGGGGGGVRMCNAVCVWIVYSDSVVGCVRQDLLRSVCFVGALIRRPWVRSQSRPTHFSLFDSHCGCL